MWGMYYTIFEVAELIPAYLKSIWAIFNDIFSTLNDFQYLFVSKVTQSNFKIVLYL